MNTENKTKPLTEDAAAETATADYLKGRYEGMSDDMASLWARAIAIEERDKGHSGSNLEMSEELKTSVDKARESFRAALEPKEVKKPAKIVDLMKGKSPEEQKEIREQARINSIKNGLIWALEKNDSFHAYISMEEAISEGIDLSDIIQNTATKLDPQAMEAELRAEMESQNDLPIAVGGA